MSSLFLPKLSGLWRSLQSDNDRVREEAGKDSAGQHDGKGGDSLAMQPVTAAGLVFGSDGVAATADVGAAGGGVGAVVSPPRSVPAEALGGRRRWSHATCCVTSLLKQLHSTVQ